VMAAIFMNNVQHASSVVDSYRHFRNVVRFSSSKSQATINATIHKGVLPDDRTLLSRSADQYQRLSVSQLLFKKGCIFVDNVGTSISADDVRSFVSSMSVNVISCFEVKPRWRRSVVVRTLVSADELSLSCARPLAGWVTTLWLSRPLSVSQHGQLSHPSFRGR